MSEQSNITVELLDGDHPLIRFPFALCTRTEGSDERRMAGQLNLSLGSLEELRTLRDSASALLAFHQGCEGKA